MHLTPREQERLLLSAAADLARRRLARGALLGATEAVALVCDEICEMAWDDLPLGDVVDRARHVVPASALLPEVPALVPQLQVEALFPHGTVLVHVAHPFGEPAATGAGAVVAHEAPVELAPARQRRTVRLHNTGAQPIWVSSHVPLGHLNPALDVSLGEPDGFRLDLPAGTAVRIGPGDAEELPAVAIGGDVR
ncbi:MAG TPA: urease subunit gamma [Nocardioidaceae bacterium]|nr:urease subunit gamma [Nocardioidaceae bacterium]